jgi:hypothetical protein
MAWVRGHRRRTGFLGSTWVRSHFRRRPGGYWRRPASYRRSGYRRYGGRVSWVSVAIALVVIVLLIAIF